MLRGVRGYGTAVRDSGDGNNGKGGNTGTGIVTKTRPKTKKPSLYKVLLLNDDYTPMEFVVHILEKILRQEPRGRGGGDAACPSPRRGHLRRLHLRGGGNKSGAGH